ncbi:hypothetical protein ACFWFZ_13365 [Streptomyces sp. NPDC060232]|uniref:hypothetical protein n=1 Tax=Streptomyces sp. NPDC060232 TaxID=3347079 RepID=UPI00364A4FA2
MPNGKEHRGRGPRGALRTIAMLWSAGILAACSSGADPSPSPSVRPDTDVSSGRPSEPSDGTATAETDEEREERRRREQEEGGFNRAGRLSDNFDGYWPAYIKMVTNPSAVAYEGTVSAVDCTPGETSRPADPPSRRVSLAPEGTEEVEFSFASVEATSSPRHICVTLSDDGGETDTDTDVMSAYISPSPEPEPDTSPPDPGQPTPTPDGTPSDRTEQ